MKKFVFLSIFSRKFIYSFLMKKRSTALDLLRIFAALWVMLYHWSGFTNIYTLLANRYDLKWIPTAISNFSHYGFQGIFIFFILSGAVIANSALQSTAKKFATNRFLRLYPSYLVAFAISLVVIPTLHNSFLKEISLTQFSSLQLWNKQRNMVGTSWTLKYEIIFYFLIFMALYFMRKNNKFDEAFLFKFLVGWLVALIALPNLDFPALAFFADEKFGALFILGACLSQMKSALQIRKYAIVGIVSLVLAYIDMISYSGFISTKKQILTMLVILLTVSVIFWSNFKEVPKFLKIHSAKIQTFALMTYPFYLTHELIGIGVASKFANHGWSVPVSYLVAFGLTLLISWACVKYFDPLSKKLYYKYLSVEDKDTEVVKLVK